jgi:iron complex transport system substrate-binding protein
MKKQFFLAAALVVSGAAGSLSAADERADSSGTCPYRRIVSLAPSVTEILFELGLGDRLVGVTRYCRYPPEAREKTLVGGYLDPNYEELLRLQPDLTIMLTVHAAAAERLRHLGLATLTVDHTCIAGIMTSIMTIGNACSAGQKACGLVNEITTSINRIRDKTNGCARPRVLVSVDRNTDSFKNIYVAGKEGFYDEMILWAGGVNAYSGAAVRYPVVAIEGIYQLNPEVIIDLVPDCGRERNGREKILAQWNSVSRVAAVRNGRVYLFEQDYSVIPGPRFIAILEAVAKAIHPELEWK